jgi:hypothetical protein
MDDLPHIAWPYQLGATVEQDTDAEMLAAAAVIACTPRGYRDDLPSFGVTQPVFEQSPLDLDRFAREIGQSDPRLAAEAEELIDLADATARTVRAVIDPA